MRQVDLTIHAREEENVFDRLVRESSGVVLRGESITTFQVNIGLVCNLACHHCHVESSPKRTEEMSWETMEVVLEKMKESGAGMLDITGGAPEMHPRFRDLVRAARGAGHDVMVRTNLTIMLKEGYEDLPAFFAEEGVQLVASLPCYLAENVNKQRGMRVYEKSVEVIQQLNDVGYGVEDGLRLDLVYNPLGASLPPSEKELEADYREVLRERFGISFSRLIAITNMPIGRFMHDLERDGEAEYYLRLLRKAYNPATVEGLMCRHQIHVSWDGRLHDCDFNYALGLGCGEDGGGHIRDFDLKKMRERKIVTGEHCLGCTAGAGSSCGGALV